MKFKKNQDANKYRYVVNKQGKPIIKHCSKVEW